MKVSNGKEIYNFDNRTKILMILRLLIKCHR